MAFHFHVSTNLEHLAERFRTEIYEKCCGGTDLLRPVTVTVQTQGIAIWLRQYIAKHSPIAMNMEMPFLRSSIRTILCRFEPEAEKSFQDHTAETEAWKIFEYLSREPVVAGIPELASYLRDDPDLRKRYQISCRISDLFDQYRIYRPDMIRGWREATEPPRGWQERIYRELFAGDPTPDVYLSRFIEKAKTYGGGASDRIISVFGISSMPPVFLYFFLAVAKYQEVHFFYLSPAKEYWADADNQRKKGLPDPELEEFSNPVLQSLGAQGRAFFRELLSSGTWDLAEDFEPEVDGTTLLSALQQDIRMDRTRSSEEQVEPDGSILIENCHTPLREIEVLHDRILQEMSNGRKPGDFLVAAPSIEKYVPFIESVFGGGPLAGCYTISDRELKDAGTIFPAFLKILKTPSSDFRFSEIFSLLENEPLRQKFELSSESIEQLSCWCSETGIRWGLDGRTRKEKCGTEFDAFSWESGIRRLLFGYAVSENFEEQLDFPDFPFDFAEGAEAECLGHFLDFMKELSVLRDRLSPSRQMTPSDWFLELRGLLDRFFSAADPAAVEERSELIRKLTDLAETSSVCKTKVPFPVILEVLENTGFSGGSGGAFLRGKITFCSMVPMRTIPMPVIAILGLNAGEFPRRDILYGFNLIAENMKPTDRSGNLEDRYFLLEMILAAREKLMFFYRGRSERDNSEVFPSPPLLEVILYLERLTGQSGDGRTFVVSHHIQAGDEAYFNGKDPNLYSYSADALAAAKSSGRSERRVFPEIETADLSEDSLKSVELPDVVSISELETFFRDPAGYYLRNLCGTGSWRNDSEMRKDMELFQPDSLEFYNLKSGIIEETLKRPDLSDRFEELFRKKGSLPPGYMGKYVFGNACDAVETILADSFLRLYDGQTDRDLELSVPYEYTDGGTVKKKHIKFMGRVRLTEDGTRSYLYHAGKFKEKSLNGPWIRHVFLSAALDGFGTTECAFEKEDGKEKKKIILKLEKKKAVELLLRFAAMRTLGEKKLVPFIPGAGVVKKTQTAFIKRMKESIGDGDYFPLLLNEDDFTEDFVEKAKTASNLVLKDLNDLIGTGKKKS